MHYFSSLALGLLLFTQVLPKAYAQEDNRLFTYTSLEKEGIGDIPIVQKRLESIRSRPTTVRIHIIKFDFDLLESLSSRVATFSSQGYLKNPPRLFLTSPTNSITEFDEIYIDKDSQSEFRVQGKNTKTSESVSIDVYSDEKIILGDLFVTGPNKYIIKPLAKGIHALVETDDSKFPPEHAIAIHSEKE